MSAKVYNFKHFARLKVVITLQLGLQMLLHILDMDVGGKPCINIFGEPSHVTIIQPPHIHVV